MSNKYNNNEPNVNPIFLSDISTKDKTWDLHKSQNQDIKSLYDQQTRYKKIAKNMSTCADMLTFANQVDKSTGEVKLKLHQAWFCKVRTCPVCQWRRSMKNTARFFAKVPELRTLYPTHKYIFLTLTVQNCHPSNLKATIKDMNSAWARLTKLASFPAVGFIRATEITRDKQGNAHPHFHCLLMVKSSYFSHGYIKTSEWAEMWQKSLRSDYLPVVDCRAIKPKKEGSDDLQSAVIETLKYSTKPQDSLTDSAWLYHITDQLKNMRFLASGGILKNILKEEATTEEMIHIEELAEQLPEEDKQLLLFGWKPSARRYAKVA